MKREVALWQIEVTETLHGTDKTLDFYRAYSSQPPGAWPSAEAHKHLQAAEDWYARGGRQLVPNLRFHLRRWHPDDDLDFVAEAPLLEG